MNNLWLSDLIAYAYQYQKEARPFKEMIEDFRSYLCLKGDENVLDVGCGSGRIMRLVWEESKGRIEKITGIDISSQSLKYAKKNLRKLNPPLIGKNLELVQCDISEGLAEDDFPSEYYDLVTAGLSIQYAEHWNGKNWTRRAYQRLLKDIHQVLKLGGRFVFTVNTPNPDFSIIAKRSWREIFFTWKLPLMLFVAVIMVWQGKWLTEQANIGRFHYLPIDEVKRHLEEAGFSNIKYKLTYAGLAWLFSCERTPIH